MSEDSSTALPEAEVHRRRGPSPVWLFPIVAALIAGGLAIRAIGERGPTITISFETASGLEAGKTTVRFREVVVGTVEDIRVGDDHASVLVSVEIEKYAEAALHEGTRFWVVRPRIGLEGVSGLATLVSGSYINMDAIHESDAKIVRRLSFVGLEEPPLDAAGARSMQIVLTAKRLGSLGLGAPVYYRDIEVGKVVRYQLVDDGSVEIDVGIESMHAGVVHENSSFWDVSGIDVSGGLSGIEVDFESMRSLLAGGIEFDTLGQPGAGAKSGARFPLFENRKAAEKERSRSRNLHLVLETTQLGSVKAGEAVLYRGVRIGEIDSYALRQDARSIGIRVSIDERFALLVREDTVFWDASGLDAKLGLTGLHVHVESFESLLVGAVAMATPPNPGKRVASGSVFQLHDKPEPKWHDWLPDISMGERARSSEKTPKSDQGAKDGEAVVVHHDESVTKEGKADSHRWFRHLFHHDR